jgi:phage-related protein
VAIQDLTIKISVDDQGAIKGFLDTSKALDEMGESAAGASTGLDGVSESTEEAGKQVDDASGSFGKFSSTVIAVNQALELAQKAYSALSSVVSSTTDAFAIQEQAEAKVRASLRLTGQFSEEAAQGFFDFASELQSVSTNGDEATLALIAQSTALGNSAEQTQELIKASAELASVTDDFTIETAFRQLNQTLTGTSGRLGRLIPGLSDLTKAQLEAGGAAKFINDNLGGLSEELTQTFGQRATQAANDFGDVLETIGKTFVEVFDVADILTEVGAGIRAVNSQIDNLRNALVQVDFASLANQAQAFGAVLATFVLPTLVKLAIAFAPIVAAAVLAAAKFLLIKTAILAVAAGVDILIRNFEGLRLFVEGLQSFFATVFTNLLNIVRGFAQSVASTLESLFGPLSGLIDGIDFGFAGELFSEAESFIDNFAKGTQRVKGNLEGVVGAQKQSNELTKEQAATQKAAISAQNKLLEEQKRIREGLFGNLESTQVELLRLQGKEVEVAKILARNRLRDFDAQLAKAGELSDIQRKQAGEARANIEKINALKIGDAQASQDDPGKLTVPDSVTLIDESQIQFLEQSIGSGFAEGVQGISSAFSGLVNPVAAFGGIALQAIDAVKGIVELPSKILDALSGLITAITEFPIKLLESFDGLFDALLRFAAEFIPNLIKAIGGILEGLADFLVELPEVLINLLAEIPDLIFGLLDKLPAIIEKLVVALFNPDLALAFVEFLLVKAPDIALRLTEFMALKLPIILVEAIIKGVQKAIQSIGDALSGKSLLGGDATKGIEEAGQKAVDTIKNISDTVNKTSEKLFAAKELEEVARGNRAAAAISNAIQGSTERARNIFQRLFDFLKKVWDTIYLKVLQPFIDGLKTVWLFIYDEIIKPLLDGLKAVWLFIYDNIIQPLISGIKAVWMFVYENIIKPLLDGLKSVWLFIYENIIQPLLSGLKTIWETVIGALQVVFETGAKVLGAVFEVFKKIAEGAAAVFKGVFDAVKGIFDVVTDLIKKAFKDPVGFFKNLPENLKNAFKGIINVFSNLGKTVGDAFKGVLDPIKNLGTIVTDAFSGITETVTGAFTSAVDSLKTGISDLFNGVGSLLDKIFPDPGESKGTIEEKLGFDIPIIRFAEGGMVPGQPAVQGDSALNDRIVALLSPGEFVLNRTQVKMLEADGVNLQQVGIPGLFGGGRISVPKVKVSAPKIPKVDLSASGVSDALQSGLEGAVDLIEQADPRKLFENLDFTSKLWDKVMDFVRQLLKLNTGGLVPGSGAVDSVPAMLTPGEFVVNEPAVSSLGVPALQQINQGQMPGDVNNNNITLNFTINTTGQITEADIKSKVMPPIMQALRRNSLDGKFIIATTGARTV